MAKQILTHVTAVYFGAGLFGGLLLQQAMPAMNAIGVTYYAITWPGQIYCARTSRNGSAMPPDSVSSFFYTFD